MTSQCQYRAVRRHRAGALGEVFVAEDLELHREVALKEMRPDCADNAIDRARFVLEAEITGRLEHPGIVPVYGFGRHPDGRPYYAMRFIQGSSFGEAVDRFHKCGSPSQSYESVAFRQLLARFVAVCNAIEYAHSRGVLHRDVKPSNIMLGKYGETLVVDWGLAKVLGSDDPCRSAEESVLMPTVACGSTDTQPGHALGTPAFMSPEQARGKVDQIGPASDIYSLGATLYYALTGFTPFNLRELTSVFENIVCGKFRKPRTINPLIPRPLEAICLKAMAAAPHERYESAQALADDVERYLAHEPVTAFSEPLSTRVQRWLRRHPGFVAGVAVGLLGAVLSAAAIAVIKSENNRLLEQANLAERETRRREEEKNHKLNQALDDLNQSLRVRQRLIMEKQIAQAGKDFLQNSLLRKADPWNQDVALPATSVNPTIREFLSRAARELAPEKIDATLPHFPLVQAEALRIVGLTYRDIGEYDLAITHLERSHQLYGRQTGAADLAGEAGEETLKTLYELAITHRLQGNLDTAIELLKYVRDKRCPTNRPGQAEMRQTLNELAWTYRLAGNVPEALKLFERLRELQAATAAADDSVALTTLHGLAMTYLDAGRLPEATALLEDCRRKKTALGLESDHPSLLTTLHGLAIAYRQSSRFSEALMLFSEVRDKRVQSLGPDHPSTLTTMHDLAIALRAAGRLQEAIDLLSEVRDRRIDKCGPQHGDTLRTIAELDETSALLRKT